MIPGKTETINRGAFLKSLGLSTSALMAFYCIGTTMTSCGSKEEEPTPGGQTGGVAGTTTGSAINFTIDLTHSSYTTLKTSGSFRIIGDVLVAFTGDNTYVAVSKACTHEGSTLQYRSSSNDLLCSNHGSEFTLGGTVQKNPSTGGSISALKVFNASLSADGNTLTITP